MIKNLCLLLLAMILVQGCSKPGGKGVGRPRPPMDEDEPSPAKEKVIPIK
jgi:hypothetical protein